MAIYDVNGTQLVGGDAAGRTMVTFGDSITWYDGHSQSGVTVNGYQYYLRRMGLTVTNLGVDGAKLALREGTQTDIVETVAATDCAGYDYVMIAGGTNDYGGAGPRPLGALSDGPYDTSTVYGALQRMIEKIYTDRRDVRLFFVTPLQRADKTAANALGLTLADYCEAIRTAAARYAVPVLDFQRMSGLNAVNLGALTADGLHPNNAGYAYLANKLTKFVEGL